MRWKIFQWMKFLFRHSSNSRKLSRQKFHNELACVFTAHYASKNADWNQQQLTDGSILANWNSANHLYCFLSNQKKVQILAFLHPTNKWIMPSSRESHKHRERAWSQASQLIIDCAYSIAPHIISITFNSSLANGIFPEDWKSARVTSLFKYVAKEAT